MRGKITQGIGITKCQGITQCNGYPLGFRVSVCVRLSVRSSDILLARFVRRLIGRKGGKEVSSLSHTHTLKLGGEFSFTHTFNLAWYSKSLKNVYKRN